MINIDFVKKVSQCNKSIPFKDLLQAYKSYPIINPNNLNLILTDKQIKEFSDAESLIIYIEKKSRGLDVKQAKINRDKRQKELVNMIAALEKNDEIITASGILGKVIEIKGAYISVNVGDNQTLKFQKSAVSSVLPKGTIDSIK